MCPCPQVRQILPAYLRLAHGGAESGGRGGDAKRKAAYARANASEFQGKVSMGSFGVGVRGRTGRRVARRGAGLEEGPRRAGRKGVRRLGAEEAVVKRVWSPHTVDDGSGGSEDEGGGWQHGA